MSAMNCYHLSGSNVRLSVGYLIDFSIPSCRDTVSFTVAMDYLLPSCLKCFVWPGALLDSSKPCCVWVGTAVLRHLKRRGRPLTLSCLCCTWGDPDNREIHPGRGIPCIMPAPGIIMIIDRWMLVLMWSLRNKMPSHHLTGLGTLGSRISSSRPRECRKQLGNHVLVVDRPSRHVVV